MARSISTSYLAASTQTPHAKGSNVAELLEPTNGDPRLAEQWSHPSAAPGTAAIASGAETLFGAFPAERPAS